MVTKIKIIFLFICVLIISVVYTITGSAMELNNDNDVLLFCFDKKLNSQLNESCSGIIKDRSIEINVPVSVDKANLIPTIVLADDCTFSTIVTDYTSPTIFTIYKNGIPINYLVTVKTVNNNLPLQNTKISLKNNKLFVTGTVLKPMGEILSVLVRKNGVILYFDTQITKNTNFIFSKTIDVSTKNGDIFEVFVGSETSEITSYDNFIFDENLLNIYADDLNDVICNITQNYEISINGNEFSTYMNSQHYDFSGNKTVVVRSKINLEIKTLVFTEQNFENLANTYNYALNGDIETGKTVFYSVYGGDLSVDNNEVLNGNYALNVVTNKENSILIYDVPIKPNNVYKVSMWIKSVENTKVDLEVDNKYYNVGSENFVTLIAQKTLSQNQWTKIESIIDSENDNLKIILRFSNIGQYYIDDIVIKPASISDNGFEDNFNIDSFEKKSCNIELSPEALNGSKSLKLVSLADAFYITNDVLLSKNTEYVIKSLVKPNLPTTVDISIEYNLSGVIKNYNILNKELVADEITELKTNFELPFDYSSIKRAKLKIKFITAENLCVLLDDLELYQKLPYKMNVEVLGYYDKNNKFLRESLGECDFYAVVEKNLDSNNLKIITVGYEDNKVTSVSANSLDSHNLKLVHNKVGNSTNKIVKTFFWNSLNQLTPLEDFIPAILNPNTNNEWYKNQFIGLHNDNHSLMLGEKKTYTQLLALANELQVDVITASAFGQDLLNTTYRTDVDYTLNNTQYPNYDTLAIWKSIANDTNKKFFVYTNLIGSSYADDNSDWIRLQSDGQPLIYSNGKYLCSLPTPNNDGVLEQIFVPLFKEITNRYMPDGFWIDGSSFPGNVCYCENCKASWFNSTGKEVPLRTTDSEYKNYVAFQIKQYDKRNKIICDEIHKLNPNAMIGFNGSYALPTFGGIWTEYRNVPNQVDVDYLTKDFSYSSSIYYTKARSALLSAIEYIPSDTMQALTTNFLQNDINYLSQRRVMQNLAISFANGSGMWIWAGGNSWPNVQSLQERAKNVASFFSERKTAFRRTKSSNNIAVLLPEEELLNIYTGGTTRTIEASLLTALTLMDSWYGVDLLNEKSLDNNILAKYDIVFAVSQPKFNETSLNFIDEFVKNGGKFISFGRTLINNSTLQEKSGVSAILDNLPSNYIVNTGLATYSGRIYNLSLNGATVLENANTTGDAKPLFTSKNYDNGKYITIALRDFVVYPESANFPETTGIIPYLLGKLDIGSMVKVGGSDKNRHYYFTQRKDDNGNLLLNIVDLTSTKNGNRIKPNYVNNIDENTPNANASFSVKLSNEPLTVTSIPVNNLINWTYQNGVLTFNLQDVDILSTIIIKSDNTKFDLFMNDSLLIDRFVQSQYN